MVLVDQSSKKSYSIITRTKVPDERGYAILVNIFEEKTSAKVIRIFAEILIGFSIIIFVIIGGYSYALRAGTNVDEISTGWVDEKGEANDLKSFNNPQGEAVYYTLDSTCDNTVLIYSERNVYTDIYVDGQLSVKDDTSQLKLFGSSPGTRWRMVTLPKSDKPMTIKLVAYNCFDNSSGFISKCYVGEISAVQTKILGDNLAVFVLGFLWVILGLTCIVAYVTLHKKFALEKDFLYLSVGTFFCAIWCSAETNLWQLFLGHSQMVHLISYISLFIIPIPFAQLLCYRLEGKWRTASFIYALIAETNAAITFFLNVTGIVEYHYTTFTVRVLLLSLIPLAVKLLAKYAKQEKNHRFEIFLLIGFLLLVAFIAVGIICYIIGMYILYVTFVRWALFFLLLILFGYQFVGISNVFVKGLQTEFFQEMALMDHLTKFYNRAGFAKHREKFDNPKNPIGIIQFDVNNLKQVNDNQGHEKGDELICLASSGIYQSFSSSGKCYRMGGDEFMVVLTGEDPEADYKRGQQLLEEYCSYANSVEDRAFDVLIAHGFTMKRDDETLNSAMDRADGLMYENKKRMKANKK